MTDEFIVIDRVSKRFNEVTALDDLSLSIHRGEFMALLGPSGCGKTTLLRAIAGFEPPTAGQITIDGQDVTDVPPDRRPVNTVFQDYALFPHMTAFDNIAFGPRRKGGSRADIKARVNEALSLVGMDNYGKRFPSEMSGGQQQRIALARAIVNMPKVLLLDEPLGALDLKLRKRMQIELKRLHEQLGMTFVFVTHDQEEALAMADRIAVMEDGRISQLGTGREIYDRPSNRYVADFIGEANLIPCRIEKGGSISLLGHVFNGPDELNLEEGMDATVMVRPEVIDLGEGGPGSVRTSGVVRNIIFVGNVTRIVIELSDGTEIVAAPTDRSALDALSAGQSVTAHWPATSTHVVTH